MKTREERFWEKVEKTESCWLWKGNSNKFGYGVFWIGKPIFSHRYSWIVANVQEIPQNMFVLHRCDIPACVNPKHLFLGTKNDNMQDMIRKGRQKHPSMKGKWIKLDPKNYNLIKDLYKDKMTLHKLGKQFGVSHGKIWQIVNDKVSA